MQFRCADLIGVLDKKVVRLIWTGSGRFPSGFPPRLRRRHFGHRRGEAGL